MVLDHECEHDSQWAATRSIAAKIGCSARILCHWVRLAATLIAAAGLTVSVAEAGDEVYLRAGIDLDRPADTRFTDRDRASTVPAALYGCGRGPDGAPHGSVGAFGTVPTVEVGLGYAATAAVRLEAMLEYHPRFHFAGQTNFLEAGLQQSAAADLLSLPGLMATYLDLPGLGLSSVGPFDPCIGAGVGAVRNRIGEMHMTFPRTTTIVPGASHVDVVWMVTAGVAMALGEHVTLDVAWRYTDAGTVHTGRGGEVAMIRLCGAPHNWIKPTHPRCPWVTPPVAVSDPNSFEDGALGPLESDAERGMERGEQEPRNALRCICVNDLQGIHIGNRGSPASAGCLRRSLLIGRLHLRDLGRKPRVPPRYT